MAAAFAQRRRPVSAMRVSIACFGFLILEETRELS
jgi:hypothetical protein